MQKIFLIFALSLVIERALEQISDFIPKKRRKKIMWILSAVLSLIITFTGRIGVLRELGIIQGTKDIIYFIDYLLTALIISSGSEPIHSLIISLESKKEELKKKAKKIEKD